MSRLRMTHARLLALGLICLAATTVCSQETTSLETAVAAPSEAARLVATLTSNAPVFDKAKACQRLAVIGDATAVPALAGLLADRRLAVYARSALETIPDRASDAALREALGRLDGELRIGVVGSLGKRRDPQSVAALRPLLAAEESAIAATAARAVGQIGDTASADLLLAALGRAKAERRAAVAEACLIAAQRRLAENDRPRAVALCGAVRQAELPTHLRRAATYREIIARGAEGVPLLVEQLRSEEEPRFRLALQAARAMETDVAPQLLAELKRQPPARQALTLLALGDLGSRSAVPTVAELVRSGAPQVRLQAIRVLPRLGDATAVPALIEAALDTDDRIAGAAREALTALQGSEVDASIVAMLADADTNKCRGAIDLAARRRIAAATPALLRRIDGPDETLGLAALEALGSTARIEHLPRLLAIATGPDESRKREVARAATGAAAVRMPQDASAALLAAALIDADATSQAFLVDQLAAVGGPKALEAVVAAARSDKEAQQDAATRVLGAWLTADAAPPLLALARTLPSEKYKLRALRGYVRIARQLDMPTEERLAVCRNALELATRPDEEKLVLEVLRRHPAPGGLAIASELLKDGKQREAACTTIVFVSEKLLQTAPAEVARALPAVIEKTKRPAVAEKAKQLLAQSRKTAGGK